MEPIEVIHLITEPTRARILQALQEHNYCVYALSKKLTISASAVSQHMRVLRKAGVVTGQKIGYQMHYRVNTAYLADLYATLAWQLRQKYGAPQLECTCEFSDGCSQLERRRQAEAKYEH